MVRTRRNAAWITALCGLGLLLLALSPLPIASDLEARGEQLLAPAASALHSLTRPVADVVLHAGQLRELSRENAELRQSLVRAEAEAALLREERASVEQVTALRAAVGNAAGYLPASVLVRDPAPGKRVLVIDRGSTAGVRAGQPVLGPSATLVGVVVDVRATSARVRLLSDGDSGVSALLQQARVPGALVGGDEGLRLEFVPAGSAVAAGDLVLSSPLGGRLPPGLLIGRVAEVRAQPQELFATIEVEPLTDYARLEHVLVVTDFQPSEGP